MRARRLRIDCNHVYNLRTFYKPPDLSLSFELADSRARVVRSKNRVFYSQLRDGTTLSEQPIGSLLEECENGDPKNGRRSFLRNVALHSPKGLASSLLFHGRVKLGIEYCTPVREADPIPRGSAGPRIHLGAFPRLSRCLKHVRLALGLFPRSS